MGKTPVAAGLRAWRPVDLFKPAVARVEDAEESRKSNAWEEISFFLFPHAARMHVGPASNLHGENSLFRLFNDRAESSIDTRLGKAPQTIVEARFFKSVWPYS
jgi:hypothetical protein